MATPITIAAELTRLPLATNNDPGVDGLLRVCAQLIETSVIHYEFAAVALEKALQALELKLRIVVNRSSKDGMSSLIKQLERRGTLTHDEANELLKLVRIRNQVVGHPQSEGAKSLVVIMGYLHYIHAVIAKLDEATPNAS